MSIARHVATVGSATMLSRLLGFFRDVGIAATLGAGILSDAFFAALQIPNLFRRLLAEGALNAAFVPMWLRIREESGSAGTRRFGEEILGAMFFGLSAFAVLCFAGAPLVIRLLAPGFAEEGARYAYAVEFVRLSVGYVAVSGIVAVAASVLNAERRVAAAAYGLVVFNLVLVAVVAALLASGIDGRAASGQILSGAVVVAGLAQLALVGGAMWRLPAAPVWPRLAFSETTRRFFLRAIPGMIAGGIPQLKLMGGAIIASSSPAAVSWLYYANRLYELPLGVVSVAISTVMVPAIAASVRTRHYDAIAAAQSRAFEIALGLALPSAIAFAVLAGPIVGGLFERGAFGAGDTRAVAAALTAICAGLPGHILEKAFGAVSFAHEDTKTPMLAALAGLTTAIAGALLLFPHYGHVGIAAAIALSGWIGASLMALVLLRRRWLSVDAAARRRLPRMLLASLVMGAAILLARDFFDPLAGLGYPAIARVFRLAGLVAFGLAVYVFALKSLGVASAEEIVAAMRQRL
jgi:putative peptidoglycan lipid II flippase